MKAGRDLGGSDFTSWFQVIKERWKKWVSVYRGVNTRNKQTKRYPFTKTCERRTRSKFMNHSEQEGEIKGLVAIRKQYETKQFKSFWVCRYRKSNVRAFIKPTSKCTLNSYIYIRYMRREVREQFTHLSKITLEACPILEITAITALTLCHCHRCFINNY